MRRGGGDLLLRPRAVLRRKKWHSAEAKPSPCGGPERTYGQVGGAERSGCAPSARNSLVSVRLGTLSATAIFRQFLPFGTEPGHGVQVHLPARPAHCPDALADQLPLELGQCGDEVNQESAWAWSGQLTPGG